MCGKGNFHNKIRNCTQYRIPLIFLFIKNKTTVCIISCAVIHDCKRRIDYKNKIRVHLHIFQVLGRNWRIRYDAKVRLSVVTNVMAVEINTCVQQNIELHPSYWFRTNNNVEVMMKVDAFERESLDLFYSCQRNFIGERIRNMIYIFHI